MRWLLTVPEDVDLGVVEREVTAAGGSLTDDPPQPLEGARGMSSERVVYAAGPADLTDRLRDSTTVLAAYPDSAQELY